jgi:hypothetical protein
MSKTAVKKFEPQARLPLHLLPEHELANDVAVSVHSVYTDLRWQFDWRPGQNKGAASVNFDLRFHDRTRLADPQHASMLSLARRLVLIHLNASNAGSAVRKDSGIGTYAVGLRRVLEWMVMMGLSEPRQLTRRVLESLLDDLGDLRRGGWGWTEPAGDEEEGGESDDEQVDRGITWAPAFRIVRVVQDMWDHRASLARAGFDSMPEVPWGGRSAKSLAKEAGGSEPDWIPPLPDAVAVSLINSAFQMLGEPAKDVHELQEAMYDGYFADPGKHWRGPGTTASARMNRQRKIALGFEFSRVPGSDDAWHPQLQQFDRDDPTASAATRASQLVKHVQAASGITIQGMTGIRASEICGLEAGIDVRTGLPSCVDVEQSQSRVCEIFILNGVMEKGRPHATPERWLLGMRPIGSKELPAPVQAILVVNKLLARAREISGSSKLFLSLASGPGLPKSAAGVYPMTTSVLNDHYRRFAEEFVRWDELQSLQFTDVVQGPTIEDWQQSKGALLRSHQFRKTFASYVLSESPHLLAAVKRQFRHMNMALTDQGYWGSGHTQVEPFESVTRQETAYMINQSILGQTKLAGRMGLRLEESIVIPLREAHKASTGAETWRAAIAASESLKVSAYHGRDGACLPLDVSEMACHVAGGTRPLGNRLPNFQTRTNSMCTGCKCFVIAAKHLPYWEEKYVAHEASRRDAETQGVVSGFEVLKKRAAVALNIIKRLGAGVQRLQRLERLIVDCIQNREAH